MSNAAPLALTLALNLALALAACGTTRDDAAEPGSDAGQQVDAGPPANPNLSAVGTWTMSGTTHSGCGMNLSTTMTGAAHPGTTHEFTITNSSQFNGQGVVLRCELGATTKFTCTDYVASANLGGCLFNGGMRTISGHVSGTSVDLVGSVHTSGTGSGCPPSAHCGPKELSVSGTVAR